MFCIFAAEQVMWNKELKKLQYKGLLKMVNWNQLLLTA